MSGGVDPRYLEDVRNEATTRLSEFLARYRATGGREAIVRVEIRTVAMLTVGNEQEIRMPLEEVRATYSDVRTKIEFSSGPVPDPPGYAVVCELVTRACLDEETQPPDPAADGPAQLLTLRFGSLRFEYLLESRPGWVPLLRSDHRYGADEGLLLPRSMARVPAGHLLDLEYAGGILSLRRTPLRPEVTVLVDSVELPSTSAERRVAPSGVIEYRYQTGMTLCELYYELLDWSTRVPSPAGTPDRKDGSPFWAALTVAGSTGFVEIMPPAEGERAQDRRFPIPTNSPEWPSGDIHAQVLYTRAVGQVPVAGNWHVKTYRCATPQHAVWLRSYLRTQAVLIEQVNAVADGMPQEPPWAIAPVHVLTLDSGHQGGLRPTNLALGEQEIRDDPDNRLSAWFGFASQPQPDCFVLVVSPLLARVGWAPAQLRRSSPGVDQLPALTALAIGLDACHKREIAHCDVKPENVCRFLRLDGAGPPGYVLVDGDAVTRTTGGLSALRFTPSYASAEIIARARRLRAPDRKDVPLTTLELREHDRFGFVLVVLTAVAGEDRVSGLLIENDDGKRGVDEPDVVAAALRDVWPEQWSPFVAELLAPFTANALVGDDWTACGWLARLAALADPPPVQPPPDPYGGGDERRARGRHGRHVDAIHAEVRMIPRGRTHWRPAVIEQIKCHQLLVAREARRRAVVLYGVLPLLVALLLLISAVWGR